MHKTSPGLYYEQMSSPIFYNLYSSQVYEFLIPMWTNSDITLRDWRGKCTTDSFAPSYSCTVFYYYEKFIEKLETQLVAPKLTFQPSLSNNSKKRSEDFCFKIQDHFTGFQTTKQSIEEYFRQLKSCPKNVVNITRSIPDYVYNIKEIYKAMNRKFEQEFSNKLRAGNREGPAHYVNALSAHQNTMVMNYWVEESRWNLARLACLTNTVPLSLLPSANFTADLNILSEAVGKRSLNLSIPANDSSVYYKLPITDCTTTDSGNFIVRVLVPIVEHKLEPKLVKFHSIPFVYIKNENDRHICHIELPNGLEDNQYYIMDEKTRILQNTRCTEKDKLCQIQDWSHTTVYPDPCLFAFISNSTQHMRLHCKYTCRSYNDSLGASFLPLVRQISSDRWTITGSATSQFAQVKCPRKTDQLIHLEDNFGALEIQLPCGCQIILDSQSFVAQEPCGSDLMAYHSTPTFFIKDNVVSWLNKGTGGLRWQVKKEWLDDSLFWEKNNVTKIATNDSSSSSAHTIDADKDYHSNSGNNNNDSEVSYDEQFTDHVGQSTSSGKFTAHSSGNGLIWILFLVQLTLVLLILGWGAYKFRALRNAALYSKERLVYNVTVGSNPNISAYGDSGSSIVGISNEGLRTSTFSESGSYY